DETPYQRAAVSLIGSEHREILVTRRDIAEALPDAVRHAERPLLRAAAVPLFLLSRLTQEAGVKVVLTGEGADEVFAGYDLFREVEVVELANALPASYKLRVLDEKHVLKCAARELLPASIVRRKKQPYRAPDAAAFAGPAAPEWAEELMSARAVADAGIFDPR